MPRPPPHSFLLRLWQEQANSPLRVTLIRVGQPDDRHHFETLEACFAFLHEQTGTAEPSESNLPFECGTPILAEIGPNEK